VVRAPLARILGIVNLLKHEFIQMDDKENFIQHLQNSAEELDDVIKSIVFKTNE